MTKVDIIKKLASVIDCRIFVSVAGRGLNSESISFERVYNGILVNASNDGALNYYGENVSINDIGIPYIDTTISWLLDHPDGPEWEVEKLMREFEAGNITIVPEVKCTTP